MTRLSEAVESAFSHGLLQEPTQESALELLKVLLRSPAQPLKEGIPPELEDCLPNGQGPLGPCGPVAPRVSLEAKATEAAPPHVRLCKMCGKMVDFNSPWCEHETMEESAWLNLP